jgi:hypothetical protein
MPDARTSRVHAHSRATELYRRGDFAQVDDAKGRGRCLEQWEHHRERRPRQPRQWLAGSTCLVV